MKNDEIVSLSSDLNEISRKMAIFHKHAPYSGKTLMSPPDYDKILEIQFFCWQDLTEYLFNTFDD